MESKIISIEELGLSASNSRSMIFRLIDSQIMNIKMQYQTDWEKNHDTSPVEKDLKIAALKAKKAELNALFKELRENNKKVDFKLNIEVDTAAPNKSQNTHSPRLAS